jgi:hypothetical protein
MKILPFAVRARSESTAERCATPKLLSTNRVILRPRRLLRFFCHELTSVVERIAVDRSTVFNY